MEKPILKEELEEHLKTIFFEAPQRRIKMYTGAAGMDNVDEQVELYCGLTRIYLTKKPLRLLRRLKGKIFKSNTGRYYRRIKIANHEDNSIQIYQ